MHWMLRAKSHLSLLNKKLLYIAVLRTIGPIVSHYGDLQRTATYRDWKTSYSEKLHGHLGTYPTINYTKTWISKRSTNLSTSHHCMAWSLTLTTNTSLTYIDTYLKEVSIIKQLAWISMV